MTEAVAIVRPDGITAATRTLAVEAPVAIEVDGLGYAVMMMTPAELEPFAVGFMLTERLADTAADVVDVDSFEAEQGWIVRVTLAERCGDRIHDRVRHRTSDTGCGLCGIAGLEQLRRPVLHRPAKPNADAAALFTALSALRDHQPLNAATGAVHAAAACDPRGRIVAACEDVGRHNALDKLIGRLALDGIKASVDHHPRAGGGPAAQASATDGCARSSERIEIGPPPAQGWGDGMAGEIDFLLVTSRLSFEMVDKALVAGVPMLVGVSAPTTLAVEHARAHGLTLIALARPDAMLVMSDPHASYPLPLRARGTGERGEPG